ncbi:MAG: thioredoxin domain-containing protein [Gemmatimonadales bacterium]
MRAILLALVAAGFVAATTRRPSNAAQAPDDYRVLGSPEAPAEMVVFSDFECPYCRNFALAATPAIVAEFVDTGRLRLRFVFFPLAAVHKNSVAAARAAHCAGLAGRFWAYHDYLFVRQPEWAGDPAPDTLWLQFARNLGLEPEPFQACFLSEEASAAVEADLRMALVAGVTATPTIVLDQRSLTGFQTYEQLRLEILESIEASRQ